jgi:hypothetical protein
MNRGQVTLLKALYKEDDDFVPLQHDGYAARSDLAVIRRMTPDKLDSLNGVLGAFGRRINETNSISGDPGITEFIEKNRMNGELHYRLRPEARRAIKNVPALLDKFDNPWEELLESNTCIEAADLVAESD